MKNLKNYIPLAGSLAVSLLAIAALIAMVQPLVDQSEIIPFVPDSTMHGSAAHDSLLAHDSKPGKSSSDTTVPKDSHPADTKVLSQQAAHENPLEKLKAQGIVTTDEVQQSSDSLNDDEKKKMVQIFEAMDAESAARILNNMDEFAVRQVITSMKRRQSAKILAEFEPKQAAKILKGKLQ